MDLLCFPFQKSLKHLFRPRCVTEVCKNRFLSHTCVISFEECNQHCVQRANREEVGGVTWEAFLLECGGTARDKKQNKTVNFRSGWYFKLKAASILTNGLLLQKRAATAVLRGFAILGSPFQWWPYRLFLYPSSCVALLYSMFHRTPEDLLWRLALRNAVEFVLGEKNELICCMVGTEDSQEWL